MKNYLCILLVGFLAFQNAQLAFAEEAEVKPIEELDPARKEKLQEDKLRFSFFPLAGYNPTYSVFLGGGVFFERSDDYKFGVNGIYAFKNVYKFVTGFQTQFLPEYFFATEIEYGDGFDPYYGEGSQTQVDDRVNIFGKKFLSEFRVWRLLEEHFAFGLVGNVRAWRTDHVEDGTINFNPTETTGMIGFFQSVSYLKKEPDDPSQELGWLQEIKIRTFPGDPNFTQVEPKFLYIFEPTSRLYLAFHLTGGFTVGDPTYLYTYRLGGTDRLRGYLENRFRGKHYYVEQTELRFPIIGVLTGTAFFEVGEATNKSFRTPRVSYGGGIRIGLPPDRTAKARLDFGIGTDQNGLYFDFGESF